MSFMINRKNRVRGLNNSIIYVNGYIGFIRFIKCNSRQYFVWKYRE